MKYVVYRKNNDGKFKKYIALNIPEGALSLAEMVINFPPADYVIGKGNTRVAEGRADGINMNWVFTESLEEEENREHFTDKLAPGKPI